MASCPTRILVRVTKLCVVEQRRLDPNHGQIRIGILTDEVGGVPTTIRQGDIDLLRALHDVAVRESKAVRRKNEAGAAAGDTLRSPRILRPTSTDR